VLKIQAHFDRLEDSARREQIPLTLDRAAVRAALHQMIAESGYGDVRFRITVSRSDPTRLILTVEPFKRQPPEVYERGVRLTTISDSHRNNPAAKTTGWMHDRPRVVQSLPKDCYEGLLVGEHGELLEGVASNFYAILDGELRTAGEGVLPGIARLTILEISPAILPVRLEAATVSDIPKLSEAFLTSSSRGIIPVVGIDDVTISAEPGPQTRKLRQAYLAWLESHLETL
jgi:branched-chain amino acid aminotransferase